MPQTDFFAEFRRPAAAHKDDRSTTLAAAQAGESSSHPAQTGSAQTPSGGRGFLVSIDGSSVCRACGTKGEIPHHLSLIFWQFWGFAQLTALVAAMNPSERLNWISKGAVRLQDADGRTRELVESDGVWIEKADIDA